MFLGAWAAVFADFSAFEVDQEAGWDGGASEAVVDAQEGGGWGVEEPEDGRAVVGDVGFLGARGSSFLGELEAGFQLVAAPAPLFSFVAGDALAPTGSDVGHFEEGDDLAVASVEADLADRAEVERRLAEGSAGTAEAQGPSPLVQASRRGLEAGDLPLVAFVVEDVARGEQAGFAGTLTPVPSPTRTPAARERGAATQILEAEEEVPLLPWAWT